MGSLHAVHHTPEMFDVFITARNTLWTPLLIAYIWANGLGLFLLAEPGPFMAAAALTASLDLWRHTTFSPVPGSCGRIVSSALVLITPHEHMWHHSHDRADDNFGANLALWDRLHGTYYRGVVPPACGLALGLPGNSSCCCPLARHAVIHPAKLAGQLLCVALSGTLR